MVELPSAPRASLLLQASPSELVYIVRDENRPVSLVPPRLGLSLRCTGHLRTPQPGPLHLLRSRARVRHPPRVRALDPLVPQGAPEVCRSERRYQTTIPGERACETGGCFEASRDPAGASAGSGRHAPLPRSERMTHGDAEAKESLEKVTSEHIYW